MASVLADVSTLGCYSPAVLWSFHAKVEDDKVDVRCGLLCETDFLFKFRLAISKFTRD